MSSPRTARLVPQPDGGQPEEFTHISSFALIRKGSRLLLVRRQRPERWAGRRSPLGALLYREDPAAAARRTVEDMAKSGRVSLEEWADAA